MITFERYEFCENKWTCCAVGCGHRFQKGEIALVQVSANYDCYCSYQCFTSTYQIKTFSQTPAELKALFEPDTVKLTFNEAVVLAELKHNEAQFGALSHEKQEAMKIAGRKNTMYLSGYTGTWHALVKEGKYFSGDIIYKLKPDYYPEGYTEICEGYTKTYLAAETPNPILKGSAMKYYETFIISVDEDGKHKAFKTKPELMEAKTDKDVLKKMALKHAAKLNADDSLRIVAEVRSFDVLA